MNATKSQPARGFAGASLAALATLALAAGPAPAQTTPQNSAPMDSVPEKTAPTPDKGGTNLSDKLDKSNGVLHPADVDPKMQKATPGTGTSDVIKPPGAPGGSPGATPK